MPEPLLQIDALSIAVSLPDGREVPIVNDLSLTLERGATLGIVGESGSGKSLLSLAVIGLLPGAATARGRIMLDGHDLLGFSEESMCGIRGRRIGMIFQEPMTALNPAMTVGDQIAEGIVRHRGGGWTAARQEARRLLEQVRIPEAARRASSYPYEMSGGQRQRVGIAIALAMQPDLMIADEPTTALDVTVQADILDILDELVFDTGMSLILVSHDLGVIARSCARTIVMYAGARMEEGATRDVLHDPRNPYTRGLLASIPRRRTGTGTDRLFTIPGLVPGFASLPAGCRFAPRCPDRIAPCTVAEPGWTLLEPGRGVRCIRAEDDAEDRV